MRTVGIGAKPKTMEKDTSLVKENEELKKENDELKTRLAELEVKKVGKEPGKQ